VIFLQASDTSYAFQTLSIVHTAAQRIRGIGWIDDDASLKEDFHAPFDQTRLWVFRMDLEKL
jgi:hypothetical protein